MFHRMNDFRRMASRVMATILLLAASATAQADLPTDFRTPPESARPWVYWFWMNGNITREGITADLEAMRDVGIGGCLIMHVKLGDIGQFKLGQMPPDGPIRFMSDEFCELFRYAAAEADRLGMKIDMNNADGFTGSGGPWVPVEKSMKKLVWTETNVSGGQDVKKELPQPETVLDFYRDVAVIAFPSQHSLYDQLHAAKPTFVAPAQGFNSQAVADGDPQTRALIWKQGQPVGPVLRISFEKPYTADTLVLHGLNIGRGRPTATLEVSDDGKTYRKLGDVCLKWYPAAPTNTARFDACTARHFRIRFAGNCPQVGIGDVELGLSNKIHYWEPKSGFTRYGEWGAGAPLYRERKMTPDGETDAESSPTPQDGTTAIPAAKVLDLSDSMDKQGVLAWNAPEGNWTVLRIGYTSTGTKNHPASEGGHGLECDKLHPSGVEAAFDGMLKRLVDVSSEHVGRSFSHAHIDSWEVGIQNWTEGMAETFRDRNGYDLKTFYPLLVAGHAVQSNEASERFLWDLRQTLLDMMAKNYLGRVTDLCHEHGLKFSSEAGGRQTFLHNPVGLLAISDLPMGEFWPHEGAPRVDGKAAASVSHIYGKPIAGAESFTGAREFATWQSHPFRLKQIGDEAFCLGINHFVIHYYVHQAYEGFRPGFAMGPWGIHLDRMNTWWKQSEPWFDYLARCQHLLRQGQFVADVLYFPGEDAPHYFGKRPSLSVPLPDGYDYDGCDRETLLHRLSVENGRLVLPSGMSYRYLMLPNDRTMTPELARRIRELVEAGARVIGPKPTNSPSLQNHPQCDEEVCTIADTLWNDDRVISGKTFEEIAEADGLVADFTFTSADEDANLRYIHRRLPDSDLYFVANGNDEAVDAVATFRVVNLRPEIWDPQTGEISMPAVFKNFGECVRLPMHLERLQSVFVVFRTLTPRSGILQVAARPSVPHDGDGPPIVLTLESESQATALVFCNGRYNLQHDWGEHVSYDVANVPSPRKITSSWLVHFPEGWDAPECITLDELISWTEHDQPGVKYFSGTATYTTSFEGPPGRELQGSRWFLDLGEVQVIASVKLNGQDVGTYWKPPFRGDITKSLKSGQNELEIQVTNLWPNRLIGDEQFPDDATWEGPYLKAWPKWFTEGKPRPEPRRKAFAVVKHYNKESPLLPSGLLGPVTLRAARVVPVSRVP